MNFEDVMTTAEAAERWGVSATTIKLYCLGTKNQSPKFNKNEYRKSGKVSNKSRHGTRIWTGAHALTKIPTR